MTYNNTISKKGKYVNSDVMVVGVDIGKEFHVAVMHRRDGSALHPLYFGQKGA
jgi:hypothetical protein